MGIAQEELHLADDFVVGSCDPKQRGDLERVNPVVLGFAAMDRLHLQGVEALLLAKVGQPVPAEQALDSDGQVFAVGCQSLQQLLSVTRQLPVLFLAFHQQPTAVVD
jgi:hypothetical protein